MTYPTKALICTVFEYIFLITAIEYMVFGLGLKFWPVVGIGALFILYHAAADLHRFYRRQP